MSNTAQSQRIGTVAVVGAGTMGTGIAIVTARGGMRTIMYDVDEARIERARKDAVAFLARSVALGKIDRVAGEAACARLEVASGMAGLRDADLVIEAVFEDLAAKAKLFAALDATLPPQAIFASNTSTLSITRLAKESNRPDRFVGLHFCLPAQLMKLVEVTPGLTTSEATLLRAEEFCRDTGQIGIRTQDTPGFVLNHFAIPLNNDAIRLVESGVAKPKDIDNAIRKAMGFPMGPLQLVDLVGLDTQERLCDAFFEITRNPRHACPSLVRQMVAAGWLGKRAGRGFYEYDSKATFGA